MKLKKQFNLSSFVFTKSIFKRIGLSIMLLFVLSSSYSQIWFPTLAGSHTEPLNRKGDVNIGSSANAAPVLGVIPSQNPTNIKLCVDAKTFGATANFGHHQAGNFGSYVSGDNWFQLGRFTPSSWSTSHYGNQMGWGTYGLTFGLSDPTGADKNAYVTWSNSADGFDNNLHFQFNNTFHSTRSDVMSLLSGGNVGINNIAPAVKLHVNDIPNATTNGVIARFENANPVWATIPPSSVGPPYYNASVELRNALATASWSMHEDYSVSFGSTAVTSPLGGRLHFTTGNANVRMTLQDAGGFVGIGTEYPKAKLHVDYGSLILDKWIFDSRFGFGGDYIFLAPSDGSGGWTWSKGISLEKSTGNFNIANLAGASTRMVTVDAGGVLGAIAIPSAQILSIAGNALSLSGGGGTVTVPGNDNLGNHNATGALHLNTNYIDGVTLLGCQSILASAGISASTIGTSVKLNIL